MALQRLQSRYQPCTVWIEIGALLRQFNQALGGGGLRVACADQRLERVAIAQKCQLKRGERLRGGGDMHQRRQRAAHGGAAWAGRGIHGVNPEALTSPSPIA